MLQTRQYFVLTYRLILQVRKIIEAFEQPDIVCLHAAALWLKVMGAESIYVLLI
jgi:hypothetical protein